MNLDDKLKWLETRINSSLRPRNEDIKHLFTAPDNKQALNEFLNNEDVRRLFVFTDATRQLKASIQPPSELPYKSIFFMKNSPGIKLHKSNMDREITYMDCPDNVMSQLDMLTREVFLPLLASQQPSSSSHGVNSDKMMDLLHRLMANLETTQGHIEGVVVLPLPSIDVLADAAVDPERRRSVVHVLESTVIVWIKQIKGILKSEPKTELARSPEKQPGPLDELDLWEIRLGKLNSVNRQLDASIAQDILQNLDDASSTYAYSFQTVRKDIMRAIADTKENLTYLRTMYRWLLGLRRSNKPSHILNSFAPLTRVLFLIWSQSRYYHQRATFQHLLWLISNEVVNRAEALVGDDILQEPLESYSKLKDALRVCAAFRGTYLDYKVQADEMNTANVKEHTEHMIRYPSGPYKLFNTKLYGPNAYQPRYNSDQRTSEEEKEARKEAELWSDSPWPPRNAPAFVNLNRFMERCNDVLELVQTTRHFRLLADAAEVGGAGTKGLDALVKEIHESYTQTMQQFFQQVTNVLAFDKNQLFEKAFFELRSVVKELEKKLAHVLRQSFLQCPTIGAQLRLLEVFEGMSAREVVQAQLKSEDLKLVQAFHEEIVQVHQMFSNDVKRPPLHKNMPHIVSKLLWVRALKERIQGPMNKMRKVCPRSLDGDKGWQLRTSYTAAMRDLGKYELKITQEWEKTIVSGLTERLKAPLLIADDYNDEQEQRPQVIHVNLDPRLIILLREINYLAHEPFNIPLPGPARELLRNTNSKELRVTATRLETITSKYNLVMRNLTDYELPLFARKLAKIDNLLELGLHLYTWKTEESMDFIETATVLVCYDIHQNLDIVQTNCNEITNISLNWSRKPLDIFTLKDPNGSYPIDELQKYQKQIEDDLEALIGPSGTKIHALLDESFQAVQISEASPAWQNYVDYMDAIVLEGLKQTTILSLGSMLNRIVHANMAEEPVLPILKIRLELIENQVAFQPPLDASTSMISVREIVDEWLNGFVDRGKLVQMLGSVSSYHDYIDIDEEVQQLLTHINNLVDDNLLHCKEMLDLFHDYSFLWMQDVEQSFQHFLQGQTSPNPMRNPSRVLEPGPSEVRRVASAKSAASRASSGKSKSSIESAWIVGTGEKPFLRPKTTEVPETDVPTLDQFDAEIDIYKTAQDGIKKLPQFQDVGWVRVDLRPMKEVLMTFASKWLWTFTKYLSAQVTDTLEKLDAFLRRIEPEIESITGEERDTASFMKMMRIFNEVSAQQQEMDSQFAAMHRTVLLVKKYGQSLPHSTQNLFEAAPSRWSNLKTKVSLAKQRLGPRIQEEASSITKDLEAFRDRVEELNSDLMQSDVYSRQCSIRKAWTSMNLLRNRLEDLESEAQDLIELQDLLEASVVDFSVLPRCNNELENLNSVWETVRVVYEEQQEWKRHRWQKLDTEFLQEKASEQLLMVKSLPKDVKLWDVYMGVHEDISILKACIPIIHDLSNPAMRTRHWKQLVRVTGGLFTIDSDTLKRMTLGELLSLGLQGRADDVRATVQRAVNDLSIEKSLKTFEEVWLSKKFQLKPHVRSYLSPPSASQEVANQPLPEITQDNQSDPADSTTQQPARSQGRTTSRVSNPSSLGRTRRNGSAGSLPRSLLDAESHTGPLQLIANTEGIFEELESHQVSLQAVQTSGAAGSFLDEIIKWQKLLQIIEAVLTVWLDVQEKWLEIEEVFSNQDTRAALPRDANHFSVANREFRMLMRATEKNPNVLQCCQRKNVKALVDRMDLLLTNCKMSLLNHMDRKCLAFPRFYFLSKEDVLCVTSNGYNVNHINRHVSKLFENVGRLLYEDVVNSEKHLYEVTGIESHLGEQLQFSKSIPCESVTETWLPCLMDHIKAALQYQLALALGYKKRPSAGREIKSAGARRVSMQGARKSPAPDNKGGDSRAASGSGSRAQSRMTDTQNENNNAAGSRASSRAQTTQDEDFSTEETSWLLDCPAEVLFLAKRIQNEELIGQALKDYDQGDKESLQACLAKIERSLEEAVSLLRGLEGEEESGAELESADAADKTRAPSQAGSEDPSDVGTLKNDKQLNESAQDLRLENESHVIPEEGGQSEGRPNSAQPVDTMDLALGDVPVVSATQDDDPDEESGQKSVEARMTLLPGQIKKISYLIVLLAHQRDVLQRLMKGVSDSSQGNTAKLLDSFVWLSQLHCTYNNDDKSVAIKCFDDTFEYGWEYQGSCSREVLTPLTERIFLSLSQAVSSYRGSMCMSASGNEAYSLVTEFSHCLGRPLYNFNLTSAMDTCMFGNIMKGLALTGAWISLSNISSVGSSVLSICAQMLSAVLDALRAGISSCHLLGEELTLNPSAAVFSVVQPSIEVTTRDPNSLLVIDSPMLGLPEELMAQFRTVSVIQPDLLMYCEFLLIGQGFENARSLTHKISILIDIVSQLMSGDSSDKKNSTAMSVERRTGHRISTALLQSMIVEAGSLLEKQQAKQIDSEADNGSINPEDDTVVSALKNTLLPRLQDEDVSVFSSMVAELWPGSSQMLLLSSTSQREDKVFKDNQSAESQRLSKYASQSRLLMETQQSVKGDTDGTTLLPTTSAEASYIEIAVKASVAELGLLEGDTFYSKVVQLAQLNNTHRSIIVSGPAGCGKSECIKTYAITERKKGKKIDIQSVFTKSVESEQLLGFHDVKNRTWHSGLISSILNKLCAPSTSGDNVDESVMKLVQLDGEIDADQIEVMESLLQSNGTMVMANNERIVRTDDLHFVWETDSLAHLSPALLSNVGVLSMTGHDVTWRMTLSGWLSNRLEEDKRLLTRLSERYFEPLVDFCNELTKPAITSGKLENKDRSRRVIWQSEKSMVDTFTVLFVAIMAQFTSLSNGEVERYFTFALIWAFGGTLEVAAQDLFSSFWRRSFSHFVQFPVEGTVFDYQLDPDTHQFVKWSDNIPAYTAKPYQGIPNDAFVHTVTTMQLTYLMGLLSEYGKSVMLVGESGCGKTAITNERIRTVCSGEVAEVLGLTINANRFTDASLLHKRLDEKLEWKHGRTYIPRGNKRLLCLLDDINLAKSDRFGHQTAVELVRQHQDDGGFYTNDEHIWRYAQNVTYLLTVNPEKKASTPDLNPRFIRHFAVFHCPYPNNDELESVFTTLLTSHYVAPETSTSLGGSHHFNTGDDKLKKLMKEDEQNLKADLNLMVKVTLELQDRLRTMFLPIAERCHYVFTTRDLRVIFRNVCLSTQADSRRNKMLLLWEHECEWVYGQRMGTDVDRQRFRNAFISAVKKQFKKQQQIDLLSNRTKAIFTNLVDMDSGMVITGNLVNINSGLANATDIEDATDMFRPMFGLGQLRTMVKHSLDEYNKSFPKIKLALYRDVLEKVTRIIRVIGSPHEVGHLVLVAEGCPARCTTMAALAANLNGFSIYKISPSQPNSPFQTKMDDFKADLVAAYTKAGVKGERVLLLLEEDEIQEEDFLINMEEFIVSDCINHLFSAEEVTTIINSIRTEVTQAGLTYTRDVAWQFFCDTVRKNFRICVIMAGNDTVKFQQRCQQYPGLMKNVNYIWFPHWSKAQLVQHAFYHLKKVAWLDRLQHENLAYLLATMHLVIHQQDGNATGTGKYGHITNLTYEKFVERFIQMLENRYDEINSTHEKFKVMNDSIAKENSTALRLQTELEHEKVVLEDRKQVTVRMLSQIGQDTAITQQQVRIVKVQMEKIKRLKKLLPEYQVAHERAVFKAIAVVADTKKVVQELDSDSLAELRSTQKAITEVEDLMATVIMVLKNPQADLTWQKGAKRQMANLERFIEELLTFDENALPEATLALVEPYLTKPSFDPESLQQKTNISACAALCKWVKGVCRYHRLMISKVKPLHKKVEETTAAIDTAEQKMAVLENKRQSLEVRLADLAKGFEEATIDKNNQRELVLKMELSLKTANKLKRVLRGEKMRLQQVLDCLPQRKMAIPGGTAMAAALCSYLGPYPYNFRRLMLTVCWPSCLRERGIPLVVDSIHVIKGRVVDWSIAGLRTASGASGIDLESLYTFDPTDEGLQSHPGDLIKDDEVEDAKDKMKEAEKADQDETKDETKDETRKSDHQPESEKKEIEEGEKGDQLEKETSASQDGAPKEEENVASEAAESPNPVIQAAPCENEGSDLPDPEALSSLTSDQYSTYIRSLLKLLVGEDLLNDWIHNDFSAMQLENAAILATSWQRPPLLIDPSQEGLKFLHLLNGDRKLVTIDLDVRTEPQVIESMEKCILQGKQVLLENCDQRLDTTIMPMIYHRNTSSPDDKEETRLISFIGRRIMCKKDFRLFLSTPGLTPQFSSFVSSLTTLVSYVTSNETLVDDLLTRAFAKLQPSLYNERRQALSNIYSCTKVLTEIQKVHQDKLKLASLGKTNALTKLTDEDVRGIGLLMQKKIEMALIVKADREVVQYLDTLKDELFPLARRATMLYAVLQSLSSISPEYQFSLTDFLDMFDSAVLGDFPELYAKNDRSDKSEDSNSASDKQTPRKTSLEPDKAGKTEDRSPQDDTNSQEKNVSNNVSSKGEVEVPLLNVEIPEIPHLPSENLEYESLPDDDLKKVTDNLTSLVFTQVQRSLRAEHRLLFAMMVCINMQEEKEDYFTEEEMSLLWQGNPGLGVPLSLTDFGAEEGELPNWLPAQKWEDLLAISVLPGPLDSFCVNVAKDSDAWKKWYDSPVPEKEDLPLKQAEAQEDGAEERKSPDLGPLNDFHQLLLLRILRPDRLPVAMSSYVSKHLDVNTDIDLVPNLSALVSSVSKGHMGILVLLPTDSNAAIIETPKDVIEAVAEKYGMAFDAVAFGENQESSVLNSLRVAEKSNSWILLENVHLASERLRDQLRSALVQGARTRAHEERGDQKFCVWMTSKQYSNLSTDVLQGIHKLAYDSLLKLVRESEEEATLVYDYKSLSSLLSSKILEALQLVSPPMWSQLEQSAPRFKSTFYAACVVQGFLTARQNIGSRGMTQRYGFSGLQLEQIHQILMRPSISDVDPKDAEGMTKICNLVAKAVYINLMTSEWDQRYMTALVNSIIPGVVNCPSEMFQVSSDVAIPVPSPETGGAALVTWFKEKSAEMETMSGLGLSANVERETNTAIGVEFLNLMETLYIRQTSDLLSEPSKPSLNMIRLRAILDQLLELLPNLLDLGPGSAKTSRKEYSFPYHRPSVLNTAVPDGDGRPEILGLALLQECISLNQLLCHIRQDIHDLRSMLVQGPGALPEDLLRLANNLHSELVPVSWLHPNCQPSTHSLSSWQKDVKLRHEQMASWLREGKVPLYDENKVLQGASGVLSSVWLGGLANPQFFLTALRQLKARDAGCTIDEVVLEGSLVIEGEILGNVAHGVFVHNIHLQGTELDPESHGLIHSKIDINKVYGLHLYAVTTEDQNGDNQSLYNCPIFMNKARQVCIASVPLPCGPDVQAQDLIFSGAAIILDPGKADDDSRTHFVPSRATLMSMERQLLEPSPDFNLDTPGILDEELEDGPKDGGQHQQLSELAVEDFGGVGDRKEAEVTLNTSRSERSQQSYKPMTPQASTLPPDLQMSRQGAMTQPSPSPPMRSPSPATKTSSTTKKTSSRGIKPAVSTKKPSSQWKQSPQTKKPPLPTRENRPVTKKPTSPKGEKSPHEKPPSPETEQSQPSERSQESATTPEASALPLQWQTTKRAKKKVPSKEKKASSKTQKQSSSPKAQ